MLAYRVHEKVFIACPTMTLSYSKSVRLSLFVTRWYCAKAAKCIVEILSFTFLVFSQPIADTRFRRDHP